MDDNTVFVRTSKGEDEAHSKTAHLPGDIRRALLVVDGVATLGELGKRAAPSLRASLGAMLQELERDGYIKDKSAAIHPPKTAFTPKMVVPSRKAVPPNLGAPQEAKPTDDTAGDLDFLTGFTPTVPMAQQAEEAAQSTADAERLRAEAEEEVKREREGTRPKAEQEAADRLRESEREAARAREEAERDKEKLVAEARAREEAARRIEAEAERVRAEQVMKARLTAEARALQQAEAARGRAEQAAAAREASEVMASQEREANRAAEGRAQRVASETSGESPSASKSETFTFEAFQLESQPVQHGIVDSEQKIATPDVVPAGKEAGTFAFDAFQVDAPQPPMEQPKEEEPKPASRPESRARAASGEVRQPARQEAVPAVEEKLPLSGTSQEEIERATRERMATEKRVQEEALAARKQAEAQAKAHAEARKRAEQAVRMQFEEAAREVKFYENVPSTAKAVQAVRSPRKPFTAGSLVRLMFTLGFVLLMLLLGALFVAPYAVPARDYIPTVEKFLSAKLDDQPVHIGRLSGRILPTPRLELGEVEIGRVKQLKVEQASINFALRGLVIEAKPVNSVELRGARVSGNGLQSVSVWMQRLAADNQYPVASIVLSQGILDAGAVQLADVEGALNFGQIGEFTNAKLSANGGKYMLDMDAAAGGRVTVDLTVRNSALPLLPNWHFEELTAEGELSSKGLSISEFHGGILDGFLQGKATIDWRSGWLVQGSLVAKTISLQRLNKLLEGNVEGSARFMMSASRLDALADSAVLEGSFTSRRGVVNGVDVIETARNYSTEHLPGGRTHFDEMNGSVAYANNMLHLKQVKITSNVLHATATLDIQEQQLSGSVIAKLEIEEGTKPVTLRIDGAMDRPTLRYSPKGP